MKIKEIEMSKARRKFMLGTGLALATGGLLPQLAGAKSTEDAPLVVTVVEIANFYCSRCYGVNGYFERLTQAAYEGKVDLLFAPVTWEGQSLWPSRAYYAMRDLYPRTESLVRDTLFHGIHAEGQIFETISQVRQYFERKGLLETASDLVPGFKWEAAAERAEGDEPLYSELRAGRLIDLANVEEVPSFLWLGDGRIADMVTPADSTEPGQIATLVTRKLNVGVKR